MERLRRLPWFWLGCVALVIALLAFTGQGLVAQLSGWTPGTMAANDAAASGQPNGATYVAGGASDIAELQNRYADLSRRTSELEGKVKALDVARNDLQRWDNLQNGIAALALLALAAFVWWRTRRPADQLTPDAESERHRGPVGHQLQALKARLDEVEFTLRTMPNPAGSTLQTAAPPPVPPAAPVAPYTNASLFGRDEAVAEPSIWKIEPQSKPLMQPDRGIDAPPPAEPDSFAIDPAPQSPSPALPLADIARAFDSIAATVVTPDAFRAAFSAFGPASNAKVMNGTVDLAGPADASPSYMLATIELGDGQFALVPSCNYINEFASSFRRDLDAGADIRAVFDLIVDSGAHVTCVIPAVVRMVDGDLHLADVERGKLGGYTT